jgi:hypothetical protein
MLSDLAMASFSGVLVGALGAMTTVMLCLLGRYAIKSLDEYLWLVTEPYWAS